MILSVNTAMSGSVPKPVVHSSSTMFSALSNDAIVKLVCDNPDIMKFVLEEVMSSLGGPGDPILQVVIAGLPVSNQTVDTDISSTLWCRYYTSSVNCRGNGGQASHTVSWQHDDQHSNRQPPPSHQQSLKYWGWYREWSTPCIKWHATRNKPRLVANPRRVSLYLAVSPNCTTFPDDHERYIHAYR